ncbi:helix-turn-helix domain-containing protein [Haliscomenobacter hydrossis]|uniref:Helix-turn-helix domain protein n=1 Tax=Haliscomenobacter hydrossis (strain ATCC 27775 / DSM 1100 / LMG 10767 / O) TaxID=760192 RepID=F4L3A8_HALH1|nr:helix-turn-helix transcriptional regulator [Haliscomenobacter hydrossis]AEE51742.1 helix-turn-helix domain protein [Haliscomenobacter hydrossis DSM 1100]
MEHVLQNIRLLRNVRNYSKEYLAAELDITPRQYNNLENGKSVLSLKQLEMLAKIFGVHLMLLCSENPLNLPENLSTFS